MSFGIDSPEFIAFAGFRPVIRGVLPSGDQSVIFNTLAIAGGTGAVLARPLTPGTISGSFKPGSYTYSGSTIMYYANFSGTVGMEYCILRNTSFAYPGGNPVLGPSPNSGYGLNTYDENGNLTYSSNNPIFIVDVIATFQTNHPTANVIAKPAIPANAKRFYLLDSGVSHARRYDKPANYISGPMRITESASSISVTVAMGRYVPVVGTTGLNAEFVIPSGSPSPSFTLVSGYLLDTI